MDKEQKDIQLFMDKAGQSFPTIPTIPDDKTIELRLRLILEEFRELVYACGYDYDEESDTFVKDLDGEVDIVEVADALTDINYVTKGAGIAFGIDLEPIFKLVQDSNMAKFGPGGYRREDGKWMKPPDWKKPDIAAELARQNVGVEMLPFDPKREYIVYHYDSNVIVDTESPDFFANKKNYGVPRPTVNYTDDQMARFRGEYHV